MSEQMQSEIADLNSKFEEIDDPRRCYALVQERIRRYRENGTGVPQDLELLAKQLLTDCLCESQGR